MNTFQQVVQKFETAVNNHLALNTFAFGTIDKLDSTLVNVAYPYAFLRPLTSQGLQLNDNGQAGVRQLTFELYVMDVPYQTDSDYLSVMSDTERYIYDIISAFNLGSNQAKEYLTLASIAPLNEAFQDRVFGFVATINFNEKGILDYCDFPS